MIFFRASDTQTIRVPYGYTFCCQPLVITHPGSFRPSDVQILSVFPRDAITPPGNCLEASTCASCRGLRYQPPCYHPPLVTAWKRQKVPVVAACGIIPHVITPPAARGVYARCTKYFPSYRYHPLTISPPGDEKLNSNKSCPLSPEYVRHHPTIGNHPV